MVREREITYNFKPNKIIFPAIPVFNYKNSAQDEIKNGLLKPSQLIDFLKVMLIVRTFEDMIAEIKGGSYSPLPGFDFKAPTHVSIGQEATSVGSISALSSDDYITSSHRGHGDAISKGYFYIKSLNKKTLEEFLKRQASIVNFIDKAPQTGDSIEILQEKAFHLLIYRTICELFGKADGYCRGVGGSMHIADFSVNHLGANAIVGGHMGIAAGAGMSSRYRESGQAVLCMAGDGAYSNGISHEAMNLAAMSQFKNGLMERSFGIPVIFGIVNNQYAMSGQESDEITGVDFLARRAAGYKNDAMHAEVVNGMDVLAVHDAVRRALKLAKNGEGPLLLEFITYRFKGHSLHDPLTYRTREEQNLWKKLDPIDTFSQRLLNATAEGKPVLTEEDFAALKNKIWERNAAMAKKSREAHSPQPETILFGLYAERKGSLSFSFKGKSKSAGREMPKLKRDNDGKLNMRLAVREALIEEMKKDESVIIFGEDIAEYGGAFGVTATLLESFGRERVFNTSISEAGIIGSAIGMAMTGLRPVVEIMYADFILQAMDQLGNQAAKWQYMSGGRTTLPLVVRCAIGGGRGYAGQHSQSLESILTHIPGLIIIAPSNAYDAKGLLKLAIRDENPTIFFEHQLLYNNKERVPEDEYTLPIGKAFIKRQGKDITIISWSYMVKESLKAADILSKEGIEAEVIDLCTLIPLDMDTILTSVGKTGKAIVTSQAVTQGSFTAEIASQIQERAFDLLDAPVLRLGAINGVSPSSPALEKLYLPDADKLVSLVKNLSRIS